MLSILVGDWRDFYVIYWSLIRYFEVEYDKTLTNNYIGQVVRNITVYVIPGGAFRVAKIAFK